MDQTIAWRLLESDCYSPRRLHDSQYDFSGDRFLPNRSLMNLDKAHSLLTNRTPEFNPSKSKQAYRQKLIENLNSDSEGRPFRTMVFGGSPKSSRKSNRFVDEMRQEEAVMFDNNSRQTPYRRISKVEGRVLYAPGLINDYYVNILSWGKNNVLAVALGPMLYLWNPENQRIHEFLQVHGANDWPTSVTWSEDARTLAVGYTSSKLQLWDVESSELIRNFQGHSGSVASTAWNGNVLTSGSHDKSIINHDVRARNSFASCITKHASEVCGLKWSTEGNRLASGGNDNLFYIWEASNLSSSKFLYRLSDHSAAVKALAWCTDQYNVLASGGGLNDGCIKLWNRQKEICINSIEAKAQMYGPEWNSHHKEILSGHGYSKSENQNKLWGSWGNTDPESSIYASPDGVTVASAEADETLGFWDVFRLPAAANSTVSDLQGLLSLRTTSTR